MASVKSATSKAVKEFEDVAEDNAEHFDKFSNGAGDALRGAGDAMKGNVERAMGAAAEISAFGKGNLEAWVASSAATQKGVEAISARAMAYSKNALENHVAAAKSLMGARTVQEVVQKQTEYARSAFDQYVAELNSMSGLMAAFTQDALKPINERVSAMSTIMQNGRMR